MYASRALDPFGAASLRHPSDLIENAVCSTLQEEKASWSLTLLHGDSRHKTNDDDEQNRYPEAASPAKVHSAIHHVSGLRERETWAQQRDDGQSQSQGGNFHDAFFGQRLGLNGLLDQAQRLRVERCSGQPKAVLRAIRRT